jgi:hypothetical protein
MQTATQKKRRAAEASLAKNAVLINALAGVPSASVHSTAHSHPTDATLHIQSVLQQARESPTPADVEVALYNEALSNLAAIASDIAPKVTWPPTQRTQRFACCMPDTGPAGVVERAQKTEASCRSRHILCHQAPFLRGQPTSGP